MSATDRPTVRGRGASANPRNRFLETVREADPDAVPGEEEAPPRTAWEEDATRTILSRNDLPDVPYRVTLNPYRGCEHGCAYCYARVYHEYLGHGAGLDFETRILAKTRAPELLDRELAAPGWTPQPVSFSGATDAYQPLERRLEITRRCLRVLADFRNPVSVITKNALVRRDADVLAELAAAGAAQVTFSLTTLDARLQGRLEPRASCPSLRLAALAELGRAGVPAGVLLGPLIPGLNDHEVPALLAVAREAGARWAGYTVLRLPGSVGEVFLDWLARHEPLQLEKVKRRLAQAREGGVDDTRPGARISGTGAYAAGIGGLFRLHARRLGLPEEGPALSAAAFRVPVRRADPELFRWLEGGERP